MRYLHFPDCPCQRIIPKDKTIFILQAELGTSPARSNDFLRLNSHHLISMSSWQAYDFNVFWACMDVYAATGNNYFADYLSLVYRGIDFPDVGWDFSNGIESWFSHACKYYYNSTAERYIYFVDLLHFFGIDYYEDIPFSEFQKYVAKAYSLCNEAVSAQEAADSEISATNRQNKINRYFNFDDFDESEFSSLAEKLILNQKSGTSIVSVKRT